MRSKKLVLALLLPILSATIVLGVLIYHDISTSMRIKMTVMISVLDVDGQTPLTSIDLGDFVYGTGKYFPGGIATVPTETYFVNNTDQLPWFIGAYVTDGPSMVSFNFRFKRGNETVWSDWLQLAPKIYDKQIQSSITDPDPLTQFAYWQLYVHVDVGAPFGSYTPTLSIAAYDSPTG